MASVLRKEVLSSFKALHKTRRVIFKDDVAALQFARDKINEEFRNNKDLKDADVINEKVQLARGVELEMRTTIVQAKEIKPGVYEARLTADTVRMHNVPFNEQECAEASAKEKNKTRKTCCQEQTHQN